MSSVRQIETHDPAVGFHDPGVHGKVGGRPVEHSTKFSRYFVCKIELKFKQILGDQLESQSGGKRERLLSLTTKPWYGLEKYSEDPKMDTQIMETFIFKIPGILARGSNSGNAWASKK